MPQIGQYKSGVSDGPRTDTRRLRRWKLGEEVGATVPQTPKILGGRGRRLGIVGDGKSAPSYGREIRRRQAISEEFQHGSTFEEAAWEWDRLFGGDSKPRQQKEPLFRFTAPSPAPAAPPFLRRRTPVLDGPHIRVSCWWMGDLGYSK